MQGEKKWLYGTNDFFNAELLEEDKGRRAINIFYTLVNVLTYVYLKNFSRPLKSSQPIYY
jgi:hypothetical protein